MLKIFNKRSAPKIYLHIGTPKTGTSAIQWFLNANRESLLEHGIIYPKLIGATSHAFAHYFGFGEPKTLEKFSKMYSREQQEKLLREEIITYSKGNKDIIISSEIFSATHRISESKLLDIKRFLGGLPVVIICYLRRQDHYIESVYSQAFKMQNFNLSIQEFKETKNNNWYERLNYFAKVFGHKNIIIRTYEKHTWYNQSVFHDFLNLLGIKDLSSFTFPDTPVNVRYGPELIEMIKCCRGINPNEAIKIFEDLQIESKHEYPLLSPVERIELLQKYEDSNRLVAKEFLHKSDERLFTEPWPEPDEPWEPFRGLSIENTIPIFMNIFMNHQDMINKLNNSIDQIIKKNNKPKQ